MFSDAGAIAYVKLGHFPASAIQVATFSVYCCPGGQGYPRTLALGPPSPELSRLQRRRLINAGQNSFHFTRSPSHLTRSRRSISSSPEPPEPLAIGMGLRWDPS